MNVVQQVSEDFSVKFSHGANLDFFRPWGQHGKKLQFNKFVGFNVKSSAVFVSFLYRLKVYGISLNMKEGDNIGNRWQRT